jgi:hypothetical protein
MIACSMVGLNWHGLMSRSTYEASALAQWRNLGSKLGSQTMHGFFIYKIAYSSVMMHLVPDGMGLPVSEVSKTRTDFSMEHPDFIV